MPQGSILWPVLFNLYVNDLEPDLECSCYQYTYADDTTLYRHSAPSKIHECAKKLQDAITVLENWAAESNLALNETKTKQMLLTTSKMSRVHGLDTVVPDIRVKAQTSEKVEEFKLLGTWFSDNLKCHIKHVTSSCYAVLSTLKKLRNLTPSHIKKQLAESLILSKIYHNIAVYHPLPAIQLKKLQRVQNAAASFVTNKYCRIGDVLSLGWLPIHERTELELMRFVHKSIWDHSWPQNLILELRTNNRLLRIAPLLMVSLETGTFQDCCAKIFNELPTQLRNVHDHRSFLNTLKSLLLNKARDRTFIAF